MNISAVSATVTAQSQANIENDAAVSMLKKTLDLTAEQGAQLVQMMDQQAGLGQGFNRLG